MYKKNVQGWLKHLDFILLDIFSMNLAFILGYMTRHGLVMPYTSVDYRNLAIFLTMADFLVLILNESMKNVLKRGIYREFALTVKHVFLVLSVLMLYLFATKTSAIYSRTALGFFVGYYVLLAYGLRMGWKKYLRSNHRKVNKAAMYILSTSDRAANVVHRYLSEKPSHYLLTGICILDQDLTGTSIRGIPVTTTAKTLLPVLRQEWVDEVVVSVPNGYACPTDLVDKLVEMGITVHIELEKPTNFDWQQQEVEKIADRRVLTVGMSMATPIQVFCKRGLDILGGLVGCMITVLLAVIIGPMIYVQSPGPIFFTQTRVGKNGKPFKMYKFRSMYLDAEARKAELMAQNRIDSGLMFKLEYDPRIIGCEKRPDGTIKKGIGNFIRDYSLDEFPQFFNVLKGDLSLVGTRPPTVDEWEQYELHHRARLAIKPGITGMWQVSGRSKITDFEQVVALDTQYIREWSFGLDLKLLVKTIGAVLKKDGSM